MPIKINYLVCDWCSRSINKCDPDIKNWKIETKTGIIRVFCPKHNTHKKRIKSK